MAWSHGLRAGVRVGIRIGLGIRARIRALTLNLFLNLCFVCDAHLHWAAVKPAVGAGAAPSRRSPFFRHVLSLNLPLNLRLPLCLLLKPFPGCGCLGAAGEVANDVPVPFLGFGGVAGCPGFGFGQPECCLGVERDLV